MKRREHKVSRETRLAYLCHLLHERMLKGKASRNTWYRHFKLVIEWEREKTYRELSELSRGAA